MWKEKFQGQGMVGTIKVTCLIFIVFIVVGVDMKQRRRIPWESIKGQKEEKDKAFGFGHLVVAHCNIGINQDLFKASFDSWRDAKLFDIGTTFHDISKRFL